MHRLILGLIISVSINCGAVAQSASGASYKEALAFMYSHTGLFGQVGRFSSGVFTVTDDAVKE